MYNLQGDNLYWDTRLLGPTSNIYVDATQDTAYEPDMVRSHLTVADYVMVTGQGKIVCIEEKKLGDLVTSYTKRRVQRQLRECAQAGDIFVLALRFSPIAALDVLYEELGPEPLHIGLLKLQMLGGYVGFLPPDRVLVPGVLRDWRAILTPSRGTLSILAGDDRPTSQRKRYSSLTPCATALARLIPGCGPVTAAAWAKAAGQDLLHALAMGAEALGRAGLHKGLVQRVESLQAPVSRE